ncbi:DUF3761 domain-containing protein [Rhodococcus koreensis]
MYDPRDPATTSHAHQQGHGGFRRTLSAAVRVVAGLIGVLFLIGLIGAAMDGEVSIAFYVFGLLISAGALYFATIRPSRVRAWKQQNPGKSPIKWRVLWGAAVAALFITSTALDSAIHPEMRASEQAAEIASSSVPAPTSAPSTSAPTTTVERPLAVASKVPHIDGSVAANAALAKLDTLAIAEPAPLAGFDDARLSTWSDDVAVEGGRNGCDTRDDILRRDLTEVVLVSGSEGCSVRSGRLEDPYSDKTLTFASDADISGNVQVDRVVALADALQKGAQQLDEQMLRTLANDPRNLQAVGTTAFEQKAGRDASAWLPSDASYRCTYVAQQVDIKSLYRLWVSQGEHDAIARVLGECGATLPPPPSPVVEPTTTIAPPPPAPTNPPVQQELTRVAPIAPAPVPVAPPPPPPLPAPDPAPAPDPEPEGGYGCGEGYYENSAGNCIPVPGSSPTGASARCNDGSYSYSQSRRGTCSGHGGVAEWY